MNKLAAIRTALLPYADEIADAARAGPDGLDVETLFTNIGRFLVEHRLIADTAVAAHDGVALNTVQARPVWAVMERLVAIVWQELVPDHGSDAIVGAVETLAKVKITCQPLSDNVVQLRPRR